MALSAYPSQISQTFRQSHGFDSHLSICFTQFTPRSKSARNIHLTTKNLRGRTCVEYKLFARVGAQKPEQWLCAAGGFSIKAASSRSLRGDAKQTQYMLAEHGQSTLPVASPNRSSSGQSRKRYLTSAANLFFKVSESGSHSRNRTSCKAVA